MLSRPGAVRRCAAGVSGLLAVAGVALLPVLATHAAADGTATASASVSACATDTLAASPAVPSAVWSGGLVTPSAVVAVGGRLDLVDGDAGPVVAERTVSPTFSVTLPAGSRTPLPLGSAVPGDYAVAVGTPASDAPPALVVTVPTPLPCASSPPESSGAPTTAAVSAAPPPAAVAPNVVTVDPGPATAPPAAPTVTTSSPGRRVTVGNPTHRPAPSSARPGEPSPSVSPVVPALPVLAPDQRELVALSPPPGSVEAPEIALAPAVARPASRAASAAPVAAARGIGSDPQSADAGRRRFGLPFAVDVVLLVGVGSALVRVRRHR